MTNARDLLNRPLFAKNAFFHKTPFSSQHTPNHHNNATYAHNAPNSPSMGKHTNHATKTPNRHHTGENRAVGKHGKQTTQNYPMQFDTDNKPDPVSFYALYGIALKGKQTNVKCVFHSDKTPSLSINADTGAFYCFGCGASGGDVLDFYQRYHGVDFLTACHELNLSQY